MDKSNIIHHYLTKVGKEVTAVTGGESKTLYAVISRMWMKNRYLFYEHPSEIGRYDDNHLYYIGPATCDITKAGCDDYLLIDGEKFYFVQTECISTGGIVQYYRGVIKKAEEADENVFFTAGAGV